MLLIFNKLRKKLYLLFDCGVSLWVSVQQLSICSIGTKANEQRRRTTFLILSSCVLS